MMDDIASLASGDQCLSVSGFLPNSIELECLYLTMKRAVLPHISFSLISDSEQSHTNQAFHDEPSVRGFLLSNKNLFK